MKKKEIKRTIGLLTILLSILITAGCEEEIIRSESDFDAVVSITLSENPDIYKRDLFDTSQDSLFYREIIENDYWLRLEISEAPKESNYVEEAEIEIVDSIRGVFHHFVEGKEYADSFEATSSTKGFLVRWLDISRHRGWILTKVAGNRILTTPGASSFGSVKIISSSDTSSLTPSGIASVRYFKDVLTYSSGDSLTLELTPSNPNNYLNLHYQEGGISIKRPFVQEEGKFKSGLRLTGDGYQHIYIDIIDRSSVVDSLAPYKSSGWGILIKVE